MSARHQRSPDPGGSGSRRRRWRALALLISAGAVLIVLADVGVSLASDSSAERKPGSTVLGPTVGASATTKPSRSLKAGAGAPVSLAGAATAHIEARPGQDPVGEIAAMTTDLGADGVSVAALNLSTGASFSYGATGGMTMGSIAKLDILETLLLQHQDAHQTLSDDDVTLTTSMIEASDNDAADTLWAEIGSDPAVQAANQRLAVPTLAVGTDGYWGLGTTSAAEQITLLKNLVMTGGPLDAASQAYARGLMSNVESDQRWGVGSAADPGTVFDNKNGWLANDDDNDLWLINSDGILTVQGQPVLMSVLTQHNQSEDAGIALVEQIAAAVAPAVT